MHSAETTFKIIIMVEQKRIIGTGKFSENDSTILVTALEKALIEYNEALQLDPQDTKTRKRFDEM